MHAEAIGAALIVMIVAGCGQASKGSQRDVGQSKVTTSNGVKTLVLSDPAKDVLDFGSIAGAPRTAALDLRKVTLRRDSRSLGVDLKTAARPHGHMTESFIVFGPSAVRGVEVQIDWAGSNTPHGRVSGAGVRSRAIQVESRGTSVRFRLPLNQFSRQRLFKWRAESGITGSGGRTVDTVPGTPGDDSYGFFPKPPG